MMSPDESLVRSIKFAVDKEIHDTVNKEIEQAIHTATVAMRKKLQDAAASIAVRICGYAEVRTMEIRILG